MQIELTPEQEAFVNEAVANGRAANAAEAIQTALNLWVERERVRYELIAAIEEGESDIEAGEYIDLDSDEAIAELMEDVKRRGRAALAASDAA